MLLIFFAPDKINITLLDSCSEVEVYLIYNFLLKEDYSWSGLFDSFYDISSVYSYTGTGWIIHFSEYFEEHWRLSEDERAKEAVEISKELDSLYEKVNKVHDYICRKATYDYNEYNGMMKDDYDYKYADAHEVVGFLLDGKIVCDGYAYTYQWLLDYLGIESIVVYGTSTINGSKEGHAWNKVRLDNKWYNIDVCWADTGEGRQYFLKSDDYFESHYHIFEEDFLLPNLRAESNYTK